MSDTLPATPPAAPKKPWTRLITPALAIVAALAVGGVAGGLIVNATSSASSGRFGSQGGFPQGGFTGQNGGGFGERGDLTAGTIESIDGTTLTVKLADGSTVKVTTSDSTTVTTTEESSVSDLAAGDTVTVAGEKDGSGDVAATTIREGETGFGGALPGGVPTAAPGD